MCTRLSCQLCPMANRFTTGRILNSQWFVLRHVQRNSSPHSMPRSVSVSVQPSRTASPFHPRLKVIMVFQGVLCRLFANMVRRRGDRKLLAAVVGDRP